MHRYTRLLLTAFSAAAILALTIGTASAKDLSTSNTRIRTAWSSLEFMSSVGLTVRCPVTIEGSFSSVTIRKVDHALIGRMSTAVVNNTACTSGHVTIAQSSLPWHYKYRGFRGMLPDISVRELLSMSRWEIESGGTKCNLNNEEENRAEAILEANASHAVTGYKMAEEISMRLEGGICGFATGTFSGTGRVTLLGTATTISIRLI